MPETPIRLDIEPLQKALAQLQSGIESSQKEPSSEIIRDGVIQRFEYTIDLCWKALQRYLVHIAQVQESTLRTKKDLFREAARKGLIADAEAWIGYYEARNQTSHGYNTTSALSVYGSALQFPPAAEALLEELRKCC